MWQKCGKSAAFVSSLHPPSFTEFFFLNCSFFFFIFFCETIFFFANSSFFFFLFFFFLFQEMADDDQVTLQSQDGQDFRVEVKVAKMSETIKNLIEDAGVDAPIPLPNVTGKILGKVTSPFPHTNAKKPCSHTFGFRRLLSTASTTLSILLPFLRTRRMRSALMTLLAGIWTSARSISPLCSSSSWLPTILTLRSCWT